MCRINLNWTPIFGVNPRLSEAAARKDELVHAFTVHDCKTQVAVRRDVIDKIHIRPHVILYGAVDCSTLI